MKIDKELIKHVASVARLNLTKEEIDKFIPELKEVLEAFSKIAEVKVENIEPSFQPVELKNITREDKVEDSLKQEQALSNTKNKKDGYFKGPRAV